MRQLELTKELDLLRECVESAQSESILITRDGRPAAVLIGIEGHDSEDLQWETDPRFWQMIEESRKQSVLTQSELNEYLAARDASCEDPAASAPT